MSANRTAPPNQPGAPFCRCRSIGRFFRAISREYNLVCPCCRARSSCCQLPGSSILAQAGPPWSPPPASTAIEQPAWPPPTTANICSLSQEDAGGVAARTDRERHVGGLVAVVDEPAQIHLGGGAAGVFHHIVENVFLGPVRFGEEFGALGGEDQGHARLPAIGLDGAQPVEEIGDGAARVGAVLLRPEHGDRRIPGLQAEIHMEGRPWIFLRAVPHAEAAAELVAHLRQCPPGRGVHRQCSS